MTESIQAKPLLPLDAPRSIALRTKTATMTWHFRRLTGADWKAYYEAVVNRTLRHNGVEESVFEADTAALELVEKTLSSVHGYTGCGENWKQELPLAHRFAVAAVLRSVTPHRGESGSERVSDLVEVKLDAVWSMDAHGKMTLYESLVHRFRHPSAEQLRKFNFDCARTRILGTGLDGVTVYPSRSAIAMRLYDELIDSVEGYAVAGEPLTGAAKIVAEMDGAHKATAALEVFTAGEAFEIL